MPTDKAVPGRVCQPDAGSKHTLRHSLKARRLATPITAAEQASRAAMEHALALDALVRADTIALYSPFRAELDPLLWLDDPVLARKRVVLPRSHPKDKQLTFHAPGADPIALGAPGAASAVRAVLRAGAYGIMEPVGAPVEPQSIDLVVVPALAYDVHGARLGYGGGYYDRFLELIRTQRTIVAVGLGYDWQLVDRLPHEPHDQTLEMIVTPSGCWHAKALPERPLTQGPAASGDSRSLPHTPPEP